MVFEKGYTPWNKGKSGYKRWDHKYFPERCLNCGTIFRRYDNYGNKLYCSLKCRKEHTKKKHLKTCLLCGGSFTQYNSKLLFCSLKCRDMYNLFLGENFLQWHNWIDRPRCRICGKTITRKWHQIIRQEYPCDKTCGKKECRSEWNKQQHCGHPLGPVVTKTCKQCGKKFVIKKFLLNSGARTGFFCSKNCQLKYMRGEKSPQWRGGLSYGKYCPKFNDEFRERVRAFWDFKCGLCGKTEEENGRKLSVHHVNYKKDACCNEEIPRYFIPLCVQCHSKTNRNRNKWEKKLVSIIEKKKSGKSFFNKRECLTCWIA